METSIPTSSNKVATYCPTRSRTTVGGGGDPTGLTALGLLNATLQAYVAALQGVVTAGVVLALPSPSTAAPVGKVARLSLLHLLFACGLVGDSDLPPT